MKLLRLAVLFVISFEFVFGASLAKGKADCEDIQEINNCASHLLEYTEGVEGLGFDWVDLKNNTRVQEFKDTCSPLQNCLSTLKHCDPFGKEETELLINVVDTWCGFISQMADTPCFEKLDDSECFKEWGGDDGLKKEMDEKTKEKFCKNLFGKNKCMRKEIVKACGRGEWAKFRDYLIKINNSVLKQCDLRVIVWN